MRLAKNASAIVLLVIVVGCHRSGSWADDPKNFNRAWGQSVPHSVHVVHSWYWRSAHFTREEAYYFEFAPHPELVRSFIAENKLEPATKASTLKLSDYSCFGKPKWFVPKPISEYEAWVNQGRAAPAILLQDRSTGEVFLCVCQL